VSLVDYLKADLDQMLGELPLVVTHEGRTFAANRSTYRRDDALQAGGFMATVGMSIVAAYNPTTQLVSLGDRVVIEGRPFRVTSAELSQDAVSVTFDLEDINK
jgi:hypothetical protein